MPAPDEVKRLVDKFAVSEAKYLSPNYNETEARIELIDPLFSALGWDVGNRLGAPPDLRDVIYEQTFRRNTQGVPSLQQPNEIIGKRPDYTFRVEQRPRFYVEAKKPAEDVRHNPKYAFQVRSYGWSTKLPISVLTDFQELSIYDCRVRPKTEDGADVALIPNLYFTYDQYADRWEELAGLLSRDAVLSGSLDSYAETPPPRGAQTVDKAFLDEISEWRKRLAVDLAKRNPGLSEWDLNYAVQMTINRIIFLRICEDRGIEPYERLKSAVKKPSEATHEEGYAYRELARLFQRADERYNSGLFHFREADRLNEHPDTFTLKMEVGDKVLAEIITHLYYPYPYKFDVMPIEILGQVYEQFLGEVIVLRPSGSVEVEQKPEVRKAGGVYYTPTYIVDYIVEHTVGKLVDGKTPEEVSKLRVLDPACGSGSFLIGAYDYLLKWHLTYYTEHEPERFERTNRRKNGTLERTTAGDGWRLAITERKRILRNNIYGVDIDTQAVEVTKLSLLLKVLEGESEQRQLTLDLEARERVLPDLGDNIKCGNSLIGPDFYRDKQGSFLSDEEERRINVFDWEGKDGFPEIMRAGGFDAVIGNPPYIDIIGIPPIQREYFSGHYPTFLYRSDILSVFYERAIRLLRNEGKLGFITSNTYFTSESATKLRSLMLTELSIEAILDIGGGVFSDANVDTAIFLAKKGQAEELHRITLIASKSLAQFRASIEGKSDRAYEVLQKEFGAKVNTAFLIATGASTEALVARVNSVSTTNLGDVTEFSRGYIAYDAHRGHSKRMIEQRIFHADEKLSDEYKKELVGSDISRYTLTVKSKLWILFGSNLAAPRHPRFHTGPRIWIQRIRNPKLEQRLVCYFTDENEDLAASSGLTILRTLDPLYTAAPVTGLLNSRLINWWYRQLFHDVNIKPADMVSIPLPQGWLAHQTQIGELVETMLTLHKQLKQALTPNDKSRIERRIEATDRQIDELVYRLYGLTAEEIAIVEGRA